jgi:hypothetical protein
MALKIMNENSSLVAMLSHRMSLHFSAYSSNWVRWYLKQSHLGLSLHDIKSIYAAQHGFQEFEKIIKGLSLTDGQPRQLPKRVADTIIG